MAPDSALLNGIITSISSLWESDGIELNDFEVQIEHEVIKCHRFILGACSPFFRALFRSDMKERLDSRTLIGDMTAQTFRLILKVLYTGENVLTLKNVVDIWRGAHQLQINFLVERCEKFTIDILSMENYKDVYKIARFLDATSVLNKIKLFLLEHFMEVKDEEFFQQLNEVELIELIQNDSLKADSEDDVLFSVLNWVEHSLIKNGELQKKSLDSLLEGVKIVLSEVNLTNIDNTQQCDPKLNNEASGRCVSEKQTNYLSELLHACRTCLASPRCLETVYRHRLIQSNKKAQKIIFDAILYQVNGYRHGYFPASAMQRLNGEYQHVGIIAYDTGSFQALSLLDNKWYPLPQCPRVRNKIKISLFDRDLFAVGPISDFQSELWVLKDGTWTFITNLPGTKYFLLSHEDFLYIFNATNGGIQRMRPKGYDKSLENINISTEVIQIEFAISLEFFIIVFSRDNHDDTQETSVHCLDTKTGKWSQLENLIGSAQKMASFQDGDKTYVLQMNGNLWHASLDTLQTIRFSFIKKLWETKESLRGALLYKEKLFLYVKIPKINYHDNAVPSLPGIYTSVQPWARNGYASNFIFTIMHKQDLIEP